MKPIQSQEAKSIPYNLSKQEKNINYTHFRFKGDKIIEFDFRYY